MRLRIAAWTAHRSLHTSNCERHWKRFRSPTKCHSSGLNVLPTELSSLLLGTQRVMSRQGKAMGPEQVDEIYRCLFGLQTISTSWHWTGMKAEKSVGKLQKLVTLRGSISHRVSASEKVHKELVRDYNNFINHIPSRRATQSGIWY